VIFTEDAGPSPVYASSGLFVVFEGGDGVGKSTQVGSLCDWLGETGRPYLRTFEPGDSAAGRQIRQIVLDPATGELAAKAETLLYAADKAHHLEAVVRPALARGEVVVCDRYVDSMLAYQGAGRVLDLTEVEQLARWATDGLRPHLTVLLDGDPADLVGAMREKDRIESAGGDFHRAARQHFITLAERDPDHYLVLNCRRSRESIAEAVRDRVGSLL
jgi:dTMP kinase